MGKGTRYTFVLKYFNETFKPGSRVLETGCGGGLYRENIHALKLHYTGSDLPNPIYQTSHSVDVYCSGNTLSFANESFDYVFNQGAFDYIPNPLQTISESYRVLKPGGIFTIFTYRQDILKSIDSNCRERGREWEKGHHVFSSADLLKWLKNQGFISHDITGDLDTIQSVGMKRKIMDFFGIYYFLQAKVSMWRVFESVKPG